VLDTRRPFTKLMAPRQCADAYAQEVGSLLLRKKYRVVGRHVETRVRRNASAQAGTPTSDNIQRLVSLVSTLQLRRA
jgi:hypothetical protein